MKMLHGEILEIINKTEKEFPVNSIIYKSVKMWPYIRTQLSYFLFNGASDSGEAHYLENKGLRHKLASFKNRSLKSKALKRLVSSAGKDPFAIQTSDFLYLSTHNDKRITISSRLINPFAESMQYFLEKKGHCSLLEYSPASKLDEVYENVYSLCYLQDRANAKFEFNKFFLGKYKNKKIPHYNELMQYLDSLGIKSFFSEKEMLEKIEFIFCLQKELEKLFLKIKPKAVFFAVFYQDFLFAAVLACRKLKISSVELQHGQQGDKDPFSMNFSALPPEGYDLLPGNFWVWGKVSLRRKKEFAGNKHHTILVGGNPWMSLWSNTDKYDQPETTSQTGLFANTKTNVLIALQPIPDPIPEFLLDAVKKSAGDVKWFFRMHPVQAKNPDEILQKLSGLKNVEVEYANSLPLYLLLKKMDFVITHWSTVAYEALPFGAHPIIIHPNGKELMSDYIEKKIFSFENDAEGILSVISSGKEEMFVRETEKFIETDETVILNAIDSIVKKSCAA